MNGFSELSICSDGPAFDEPAFPQNFDVVADPSRGQDVMGRLQLVGHVDDRIAELVPQPYGARPPVCGDLGLERARRPQGHRHKGEPVAGAYLPAVAADSLTCLHGRKPSRAVGRIGHKREHLFDWPQDVDVAADGQDLAVAHVGSQVGARSLADERAGWRSRPRAANINNPVEAER